MSPLWRQANFQVKINTSKHTILGARLEVEMFKRCTLLWREARFQVNMVKNLKTPHVRTTFGRSSVVACGRRNAAMDSAPCVDFAAVSRAMAGVGHLEEDLQRRMSHGMRSDCKRHMSQTC